MSERILKTEHITQRFGGLVALSDISMEVNSGEIVGIIGPNGAGKSTLFNVITGMYNPTEGKVEMLGQDVTGWKPYRITELGFSRTFQNIRLFPRMTVQDNVIVGMHTRTKGNIFSGVFFTKKEKEERASCVREADTILRLLGLYEDRFEMGTSLPYGSQRKLEIARALATRPKLLLLDEPAAGMNEQETEELRQIVYRLKEMGYTILLIEHAPVCAARLQGHRPCGQFPRKAQASVCVRHFRYRPAEKFPPPLSVGASPGA